MQNIYYVESENTVPYIEYIVNLYDMDGNHKTYSIATQAYGSVAIVESILNTDSRWTSLKWLARKNIEDRVPVKSLPTPIEITLSVSDLVDNGYTITLEELKWQ